MSWKMLPRELQLMVLRELSDLDINALQKSHEKNEHPTGPVIPNMLTAWKETVNYRLVCTRWNLDLQLVIPKSDSILTLLKFGPQEMCLDGLRRPIRTTPTEIPTSVLRRLLLFATQRNFVKCMELILQQMKDVPRNLSILVSAVEARSLAAVKLLIAQGADLEEFGPSWNDDTDTLDMNTALGRAIQLDDVAITRELLEAGANPSTWIEWWGMQLDPMQHVAKNDGDGSIIHLLVEYTVRDPVYEKYGGRDDWLDNEDEEASESGTEPGALRFPDWHPLELAVDSDSVSAAEALLGYDNIRLLDIARAHKEAQSDDMRQLLQSYMKRAIARG
ncbi:hypothetical protein BJY01DRAFT_250650 [Aspergillus pseudoustus]|uniref:Ankyrin repeat-containing domain protein n=1 Tax=Aspergillus pseudoustus TaxID=1810923 RepID=A0ABR4JGE4_9EURO